MAVAKQTNRESGITTTPGAWTKVFSSTSASLSRFGVFLYVHTAASNNAYIRVVPFGTVAPTGFTENFTDRTVYKGDTIFFDIEAKNQEADIYITGDDGSGGATKYNAWEMI